jgi:hypothetical protein
VAYPDGWRNRTNEAFRRWRAERDAPRTLTFGCRCGLRLEYVSLDQGVVEMKAHRANGCPLDLPVEPPRRNGRGGLARWHAKQGHKPKNPDKRKRNIEKIQAAIAEMEGQVEVQAIAERAQTSTSEVGVVMRSLGYEGIGKLEPTEERYPSGTRRQRKFKVYDLDAGPSTNGVTSETSD